MNINITGIDKGILLAELHNGTQPLGMGLLHARDPMTDEEGRAYWEKASKRGDVVGFDYFFGRPLKVTFDGNTLRQADLYDRDAGRGACQRAVDAARLRSK